jgi:hypothetical protein
LAEPILSTTVFLFEYGTYFLPKREPKENKTATLKVFPSRYPSLGLYPSFSIPSTYILPAFFHPHKSNL